MMPESTCRNCGQEVVHTSLRGEGVWVHYNPRVIGLCKAPEPTEAGK